MSSKEQGSITGKLATEPSTPFIQYSPFQLSDRVGEIKERGKKASLKCLYRNIRFTLTSIPCRCQTAFNSCAKANARNAAIMCAA